MKRVGVDREASINSQERRVKGECASYNIRVYSQAFLFLLGNNKTCAGTWVGRILTPLWKHWILPLLSL